MRENEGIRVREVPDCPLCGGRGDLLHGGLRDRYFDAPGVWSFLRCSACRHAWLHPQPEPTEAARLYPSYWDQYQAVFKPTASSRRDPLRPVRAASELYERANVAALAALGYDAKAARRRDLLLGKILLGFPPLAEILEGGVMSLRGPAHGRLLDVGCGDGAFLAHMRALGWEVEGLESDRTAVDVARTQYGLAVKMAPIGPEAFSPSSFDAITMSHVIEHLWEPVQDLRTVAQWLRPGGRLVIRTPNLDSWGHRVFQASWMPLEPPRHIHLFSPRTLRACVNASGLTVVDVHTSARIAQGVYDSSREIERTERAGAKQPHRSLRSRLFLLEEMMRSVADGSLGEEIVLIARRADG